jgi:hypothetical protein
VEEIAPSPVLTGSRSRSLSRSRWRNCSRTAREPRRRCSTTWRCSTTNSAVTRPSATSVRLSSRGQHGRGERRSQTVFGSGSSPGRDTWGAGQVAGWAVPRGGQGHAVATGRGRHARKIGFTPGPSSARSTPWTETSSRWLSLDWASTPLRASRSSHRRQVATLSPRCRLKHCSVAGSAWAETAAASLLDPWMCHALAPRRADSPAGVTEGQSRER